MDPTPAVSVLVLVSAALATGIAFGGAGVWLAVAWLDRAPQRLDDPANRARPEERRASHHSRGRRH